jgi:hypothetical protein
MTEETQQGGAASTDSGCAVDWSWLNGREIASARSDLQTMTIVFSDGETLTIRAALYKDQPFLAFDPWKAR